jgi:hypothetical protein
MKRLTIDIPEDKYHFVLELMQNLGFAKVQEDDLYISEENKRIVLERIANSKSEDLIPWEEAKKQLRYK